MESIRLASLSPTETSLFHQDSSTSFPPLTSPHFCCHATSISATNSSSLASQTSNQKAHPFHPLGSPSSPHLYKLCLEGHSLNHQVSPSYKPHGLFISSHIGFTFSFHFQQRNQESQREQNPNNFVFLIPASL